MSAMVCWEFENYLITSLMLILASSSGVVSLGALPHNHSLSLCHEDESSALLHFKQSFVADQYLHSNITSWAKGRDCCLWDGVKCDEETGCVIGLDLSRSLSGNFPSNSSLFSLTHLQELDLSSNNFSSSPIPSELGQLTNLVSLDLSFSNFSGEIPLQLSKLSKLSFLDLSGNSDLTLKDVSLEKLVQNFTHLTHLDLELVNISSPMPTILANFTSLKYLYLGGCNLRGSFPLSIFDLPLLESLDLSGNSALKGFFPEFQANSSLKEIYLSDTAFYGQIPASIGRLSHLEILFLQDNSFSGSIPSSLGKLTKLTQLTLVDNHFTGAIPSSLANLTQLRSLIMAGMNLATEIPSFIANLTRLQHLLIGENQLIGPIPLWLTNLTQLAQIGLNDNDLKGPIPKEISQLGNLYTLSLSGNHNLDVNFDTFMKLPSLAVLDLSGIPLKSLESPPSNMSHPKFQSLYLNSCNLTEFPRVLSNQDNLFELHLSLNNIHGLIPQWFVNITKNSLGILDLSNNSLKGFEQHEKFLPWNNLGVLSLQGNQFQGLLPVPPNSMQAYDVSYNQMAGGIPQQLCHASSLNYLDISYNNLRGAIPNCITQLIGSSLEVLNLRGNKFNGKIPSYPKSCKLKMIALGQNQLEGSIPRSLVNCIKLEVFDIGQNQVNDTFPWWLGGLPDLQVLILRHNKFHGRIISKTNLRGGFQSLRIIDLSHNFHVGDLPSDYHQLWDSMKTLEKGPSIRYGTSIDFRIFTSSVGEGYDEQYNYSIILTNKGHDMMFPEIWKVFRVIDFSSNNFTGRIPDSIGQLQGLQQLNLSNNNLEGRIPPSLADVSNLESLDLSTNMLSGGIPPELTSLTFLEVFNVSHNHLEGPIPEGNQFDTFDNSSFEGNPGLCGSQVSHKCGNMHESPPSPPIVASNEEEDSHTIDWIVRALGCVGGFATGFAIGKYFTDQNHDWFVETFGRERRPRKRMQGAPRRRT